MLDRIMGVLFVVTALIGLVGFATLAILTQMSGPLWIAIAAAIGIVVTGIFALMLMAALLFAAFVGLCKWADKRNAASQQPL